MKSEDYPDFLDFTRTVSKITIMPNNKKVDEISEILFSKLSRYMLSEIKSAMMRHCERSRFFPMYADMIAELLHTTDEDIALEWASILRAMRLDKKLTPTAASCFAVLEMGGWKYLKGALSSQNEDYYAKMFAIYYREGKRLDAHDALEDYLSNQEQEMY